MKNNKNIIEITFFARAGQGAKSAAEILAQAAMKEGKFIQAFPYFGPERSGAPTLSYVRISEDEIRTHESIARPSIAIVLDDTLLASEEIAEQLANSRHLIMNTKKTEDEIRKNINGFSGSLKVIDGSGVAMEVIGQPRPNSVMLGKLINITEVVKIESLMEEFRSIFEGKIGKNLTDKNIVAIEKGYDSL